MSKRTKNSGKRSELGASLVEYALLLALIAVTGIASVQTLGGVIENSLFYSVNEIQGAGSFCEPDPPFELCD
jgi:Flp pilus assembly pilin Flp